MIPPPTPVPIGDEHGRVAAPRRAERRLGQRERPCVVDQRGGGVERLREPRGQRHLLPIAGQVREERGDTALCVEEAGHADPDGVDGAGRRAGGGEPADHRFGAVGCTRVELAVGHDLVVLEHDPLDVGGAEIEPEVPHRTDQPPSTVSTVPVTNGAVAR